MNLFNSLWRLWNARQLPTSAAASQPEADVTDRMLSGIQRLCATLPQGEAEVWLSNGEITFSVKWTADEAAATNIGDAFYFRLNGQNEEVKWAALTAETSPKQADVRKSNPTNDESSQPTPAPNPSKLSRQQTLLQQLLDYLRQHYTFRYNRLTDQTECAALPMENEAEEKLSTSKLLDNKIDKVKYNPVDNRLLNSISLAVLEAGIPCWDRDVKRYVESANIPAYHPFTGYLKHLSTWDGVDRITPAEDVLGETFAFAQAGEEGAHLLSAAQIYTSLKSKNPATLNNCSPVAFSKLLAQVRQRVHTRNGNSYWVKPVNRNRLSGSDA